MIPSPSKPSKRIRNSSPSVNESHPDTSNDMINGSSSSLEHMLGGKTHAIETFFEDTWQQKPSLTKCTTPNDCTVSTLSDALKRLLAIDWDTLADILDRSRALFDTMNQHGGGNACRRFNCKDIDPPLIFQDQSLLEYDLIQELYSCNPIAAYLDGCSIVINHADCIHDAFASLCIDLQRTFPHVYINTYLTPPKSSAVSAHADDRDVFVIQILGSKHWEVYQAPILVSVSFKTNTVIGEILDPIQMYIYSRLLLVSLFRRASRKRLTPGSFRDFDVTTVD